MLNCAKTVLHYDVTAQCDITMLHWVNKILQGIPHITLFLNNSTFYCASPGSQCCHRFSVTLFQSGITVLHAAVTILQMTLQLCCDIRMIRPDITMLYCVFTVVYYSTKCCITLLSCAIIMVHSHITMSNYIKT